MKKAKKTNKSEFSNKKISTAKTPRSGSAAVHDVESAGSKGGNTAVTNPEELLDAGGFYADLYNSQFEDVVE